MLLVDVGTNAEIVLGNRAARRRRLLADRPGLRGRGDLVRPARRARRHRARAHRSRTRWSRNTASSASTNGRTRTASRKPPRRPASPASAARRSSRWSPRCISAGIISEDGVVDGALAARSAAHRPERPHLLLSAARGRGEPRITVTQNDVRAIQLAKAALYAGVKLLMEKQGVETGRHDPLRRRLRLLHRSEIRDGARPDPRLRSRRGEGGRQRRRHRRADGAAQPRPPPRDRGDSVARSRRSRRRWSRISSSSSSTPWRCRTRSTRSRSSRRR